MSTSTGTLDCKARLEKHLRDNAVPFELRHHPPAFTAQRVAESEHISGRMVAKVVMVVADGKIVMLVLPADRRVNLTLAADALSASEVRLAHEDEFQAAFPDCDVGAMPPFGSLYGLDTFIDEKLALDETIAFNAGTHEDSIHMRYADFEHLVNPAVAPLTA